MTDTAQADSARDEVKPPATPEIPASSASSSSSASANSATTPKFEPTKPRRKGGFLRTIAIFFIFVIGAFVGAAIARYALPGVGSPTAGLEDLRKQIAELQAQPATGDLSALSARVTALEKSGAGAADSGAVAMLTQRLSAAEQTTAALAATVTELQQRPAVMAQGGVEIPQSSLDNLNAASTELKNQIAGLTARFDAAETANRTSNTALTDRIAGLEQKVPANIAEQLANTISKSDVQALEQRIATVESSTAALDAKRAAAAIALANLARAAQSGTAFSQELAAVKFLETDQAALAPIAVYAGKGVKPTSMLIAEFDGVARAGVRASRSTAPDWWSRLWANITSLFLVRRTGPMEGDSDEAILSRAGDHVHAGNLQTAVVELSKLKGSAAASVSAWKQEAQARIELDRLVNGLTSRLIATLSQASP